MQLDRLRRTIEACKGWDQLIQYVDRIEAYQNNNLSLRIDNLKTMLESVCKEVCKRHEVSVDKKSSLQGLVKQSATALGIAASDADRTLVSALGTLAKETGALRNRYGSTGHGRTMEELASIDRSIDIWSQNLVSSAVEAVAVFFLEVDHHRNTSPDVSADEIDRDDDFDEYWDNEYGEFVMGAYSYTASETLRAVDPTAYQTEVQTFKQLENDN